jgi:hypothetical protein
MVPLVTGAGRLARLTCDGRPVEFGSETIKGIDYAFFAAATGQYVATYE